MVLHSDIIESLVALKESSVRQKETANPVQALTPREIEVLNMLGSGLGNKAIAKRLNISNHTQDLRKVENVILSETVL